MKLSWNEIEQRAIVFSKKWKDAKRENGQSQLFLDDFFQVFGVSLKRLDLLEKKIPMGEGKPCDYADCFWEGKILIEMKSHGKNLEEAYKQAKKYAKHLTDEELPEYIMVCDFENIKLRRTSTKQEWTFKVANLSNHVRKFALLAGYESTVIDREPEAKVNEEAAKKMAKLHDKLKESGYDGHALEVYLIRLLYCMFADDSRIFEKGAFTEYIKESKVDGSDLSMRIAELFEILDMNDEKRKKNKLLPEEMKRNFKYINGKLFTEPLPMAYFDSSMREILLDCCEMNWFEISPAIFGAMFQEVTDQKKRRELGAHYTSEENILKVIKPLFLDDLREEFELIKHDKRKLTEFHKKLTTLKFLDPACGCGNFLIVAYRELRRLEIDVLDMLVDAIPTVITALIQALPTIITTIINALIESIPLLIGAAIELFMALVEAIPIITVELIKALPQIVTEIIQGLARLPELLWNILTECIGKFISWGDQSETEGAQGSQSFLTQVINVIKELPARVWEWLQNAIARVGEFFGNIVNTAGSKASEFVSTVINFVSELPDKIWNGIIGAISSVANGGSQLLSAGIGAAQNLVHAIWNTICGLPGKMLSISEKAGLVGALIVFF